MGPVANKINEHQHLDCLQPWGLPSERTKPAIEAIFQLGEGRYPSEHQRENGDENHPPHDGTHGGGEEKVEEIGFEARL